MWFVTFVIKSLLRQPARSSFTAVGIGLAVAATVSLVGISSGFERSYLNLYATRGVDLVVQRSGRTQQLGNEMDERFADRIRELPGVYRTIGGLVDVVSFEEADLFVVLINGWPPDSPVFDDLKILSGRAFDESDDEAVMLGKVLAGNLGKKVGDEVDLYGRKFSVIGIFESTNIYENGSAAVPLAVLQRLTDRPHEVSGITVHAEPGSDRETIERLKREIEALDPGGLSVLATGEFVASITQIRVARAMAWVTSTVAMVLGGIGVLNTMAMSVYERTREFGLLRALGWPRRRVVRTILAESALLALTGAVLGSALGLALPKLLGHVRAMSGLIEGTVDPLVVLQGFGIALLMGLVGAAYPAYWGASLRPIEAMQRK
ncbi:MAG TPA: ABC transporter permease [Pirellulales bacterium]|nr:ABC transporter permease [Pirellulales bacterium]